MYPMNSSLNQTIIYTESMYSLVEKMIVKILGTIMTIMTIIEAKPKLRKNEYFT